MKYVLFCAMVGCRKSAVLPQEFAGTYARTAPANVGLVLTDVSYELAVAPGGIGIKTSNPQSGEKSVVTDSFLEVACAAPTICHFKTKLTCECTIEKKADGSLVIQANDACPTWSGIWNKTH